MKARFILALAIALAPLGTSAHITVTPMGDDRFRPIHEGLTAEQVAGMVGKPTSVEMHEGKQHWIYNYIDTWGDKAIYDVAFDTGGRVERTSTLRISF
jgi:outer membrane protein assembly factor BamE (lipoprotein component of BamABCDE complex)